MAEIIEFIISNSAWILILVIVILLSIVGSYAEKTNFGLGNKLLDNNGNSSDETKVDLSKKRLGDLLGIKNDKSDNKKISEDLKESNQESNNNLVHNENTNYNAVSNIESNNINQSINQITSQNTESNYNVSFQETSQVEINKPSTFEEKFEKLDDEFYQVLPKKEVIDEDILDSIDDILFTDKKSEYAHAESFDDIELPEIKPLKEEEFDIWKF